MLTVAPIVHWVARLRVAVKVAATPRGTCKALPGRPRVITLDSTRAGPNNLHVYTLSRAGTQLIVQAVLVGWKASSPTADLPYSLAGLPPVLGRR
jgi:hypothetical protein